MTDAHANPEVDGELAHIIPISPDDIDRELAVRAYTGTSWVPDQRADQLREGYVEHMTGVLSDLQSLADTQEKRALLAEEFARFKGEYLKRLHAWLSARSRCVSPFIVGPAKFAFKANERRMNAEYRKLRDLTEWEERALRSIRKRLQPEKSPVSSDDPDAIRKLRHKLAELERQREYMKQINREYRKVRGDVDAMECSDKTRATIRSVRGDMPAENRRPFEDWQLRNLGAQIRRLRQRIAELESQRNDVTTEIMVGDVRIVDDVEANRLRIYFPSKPSSEIRARLKSRGFRWAPSVGAWQRKRSRAAIEAAMNCVAD